MSVVGLFYFFVVDKTDYWLTLLTIVIFFNFDPTTTGEKLSKKNIIIINNSIMQSTCQKLVYFKWGMCVISYTFFLTTDPPHIPHFPFLPEGSGLRGGYSTPQTTTGLEIGLDSCFDKWPKSVETNICTDFWQANVFSDWWKNFILDPKKPWESFFGD